MDFDTHWSARLASLVDLLVCLFPSVTKDFQGKIILVTQLSLFLLQKTILWSYYNRMYLFSF